MADDGPMGNLNWRNWLYGALLGVAFGSGGAVYQRVNDPRPDPYTGTQAAQDKVWILKRLDRKRDAIEDLKEGLHRLELEHRDMTKDIKHLQSLIRQHFQHSEMPPLPRPPT